MAMSVCSRKSGVVWHRREEARQVGYRWKAAEKRFAMPTTAHDFASFPGF